MKKTIKLLIPVFLIAAAFAAYLSGMGTKYSYSDISGHDCAAEIERVSERGILTGSEGKFRPDDSLTLAEFCTVMTRLFPMEDMAENTFSDIDSDGWYAAAVLKCVKAGIIDAEGRTELQPAGYISREEAMTMLARAMGLSPSGSRELISGFNDAKNVSAENIAYIEALLEAGISDPHLGRQLWPKREISRAELAVLLDNLI